MPASARRSAAPLLVGMTLGCVSPVAADEGGVSAWLPGQFASFSAVPGDPGFALETIYYRRSASASASRPLRIGGNVAAGVDLTEQYIFVTPSYTFADPVLGGQLFLGATLTPGRNDVSVWGSLTGPRNNTVSASQSDSVTGLGDIYPLAMLKWEMGAHNFMTYVMPSVPVGFYDSNRLAGLGIGHWALDGGLSYTFLSATGLELSLTAGLTQNFMNPSTLYQNGLDGHVDWGLSYSPTESYYFGAAGYFYNQLGADSGPGATLGPFLSRVAGVGPQAGYSVAVGNTQVDIGLRGYAEFAAENRPDGWNLWVVVGLSRRKPQSSR